MQNGLGNWRRGENCSRKKEAELNLRLRHNIAEEEMNKRFAGNPAEI